MKTDLNAVEIKYMFNMISFKTPIKYFSPTIIF